MTSPTPQQPRTAAQTPDAPAQTPQEAPAAYQETRIERAVGRGFARVAARALAPYQTAVIRIGFAGTWLLFLLREWPHRQQLYGPAGPWDFGMARQLLNGNHGFSVLVWSDGRGWFECVYVLAIVVSALLMLGWRTRTMSVLFMVGVLSLQNRSVFIGDGGDNVIHLMAIYLVLTRCGQVWSLDARRARRAAAAPGADPAVPPRDLTGIVLWAVLGLALAVAQLSGAPGLTWFGHGPFPHFGWSLALWGLWATHGLWWAVRRHAPGEPRIVLDTLAKLAHNAALLVIMVEVCLVYATAGWYKIQGSRWQDGTAVYYPMHLDYFSPWPELSQLLGGNGLVIMLITYGTVIFQVAFPFTVFNRRLKNALLVVMICEHLSIAFLLGLPFFSLAMITADAVFLPTNFLTWLGGRLTRLRRRLFRRTGDHGPGTAAEGAGPEAAARSGSDGQPLVG
ncbi:HTTM domain-containing protein [Streptomyces yunnanensis]|uniref:Vitamin K-dependent gamma-carboxylase n=1 Tax=Streptomyces yunnanensis TaxID=156453 RepID=A0A9X8QWB5_9ACTN|nr:HTTM domain-containing protein [Streptomyces yunnanensis]SHM62198.1 Vitamin K-dependent gamma-carboxylase [Streptomyces yunnanensis]